MEDGVQPANVAIIGLAGRFPAAANPAEFWHVVRDRLEGGLLAGVDEFDADFFNVSPREPARWTPGSDWRWK
jgi:acyl transferase domain-containing protein